MKTIEEALNIAYDASKSNAYFGNGFKKGVEFAQRWIPVEEELPDVGEMVLTKMEKRHGDTRVQNYYSTATRLENQGEWQTVNWVDHSISFGHITHWRPIEYK